MPVLLVVLLLRFFLGRIPDLVIEPALFRRRADLLKNRRFGIYKSDRVRHPRLRIGLWIGERHVEEEGVFVHAAESLHKMHLVAVRVAEMIEPRSIVVTE